MTPVIELLGVNKSFPVPHGGAPKEVLHSITYRVEDQRDRGELIVVVGPSGCGKTTLLNLISGLATPTHGTVKCLGKIVLEPGPERAFVFQSHNELPWRTVIDNVTMNAEFRGISRKNRKDHGELWLYRVGLNGVANKYPRQLSGGMRQRLAIARSMSMTPRVLLMDEPFGALDVRIRLDMQDLLRQVWSDTKGTVVMVTHDIAEAVYLADEIVVMAPDPGRIAEVIPVPLGVDRVRSMESSEVFRTLVERVKTSVRDVARTRG